MKKLALGIAILIGLSILLFQVIAGIAVGNVIAGETRDDLTLSEAQALLPFQICLPAYIPADLKGNDLVVVEGEIKSQAEVNLRIDYVRPGNETSIVTIKEWNAPGNVGRIDPYNETDQKVALKSLLTWLTDGSEAEKLLKQVVGNYEVYNDEGTEYLIVEIQLPDSLRSVGINWKAESVGYQVFTRLSVEEAKRVADSMSICGTVPTSTP